MGEFQVDRSPVGFDLASHLGGPCLDVTTLDLDRRTADPADQMVMVVVSAILMVMIFAGGHISGGHYNPAVTLGVWMRGRTETKDVVPYMIFQTAGALIAAAVVKYMDPTAVVRPHVLAAFPELLAEFLFTFALVFVVINTATAKDASGNSFYGLAIGFTVLAGAFAMGSVTVGAFNPAVAVGVSVMGMIAWSKLWIFLVANFLGGAAAALTFKFLCPNDK